MTRYMRVASPRKYAHASFSASAVSTTSTAVVAARHHNAGPSLKEPSFIKSQRPSYASFRSSRRAGGRASRAGAREAPSTRAVSVAGGGEPPRDPPPIIKPERRPRKPRPFQQPLQRLF